MVDLIPPLWPFFHRLLQRAARQRLGPVELPVATLDDLLVLKPLADRPQDHADIAGLLAAAEGRIDLDYILVQAQGLLPDGDPRLEGFRRDVHAARRG